VRCAANEYLLFSAPSGQTCSEYLEPYISAAGGYLLDPRATDCQFCSIDNTNTFLSLVSISFSHRWRDFGILFVYIIFNIVAAVGIYWLARMPKGKKFQGKNKKEDLELVRTKSNAAASEKQGVHNDLEKGAAAPGGRSTPGGSSSYSEGHPGEKHEDAHASEKTAEADADRPQQKKYEPIVAPSHREEEEETGASASAAATERPTTERFTTASEF
jgi:hypothetical protein